MKTIGNFKLDTRINFLDVKDGKQKAAPDMASSNSKAKTSDSSSSKSKPTVAINPKIIDMDEDKDSGSTYHLDNKFTATVASFDKRGLIRDEMNSVLNYPPKDHPKCKDFFTRLQSWAHGSTQHKLSQKTFVFGKLLAVPSKVIAANKNNEITQMCVYRLQQQMNGPFNKESMAKLCAYNNLLFEVKTILLLQLKDG